MNEQQFLDAISELIFRTTGQEVPFGSLDEMDQWFEKNEKIGDDLEKQIDGLLSELSDEAYWGEGQVPAVAQINRESSLSGGGEIGDPHPKMESRFFEEDLSNKDLAMMTLNAAAFLPFTPAGVARTTAAAASWGRRITNVVNTYVNKIPVVGPYVSAGVLGGWNVAKNLLNPAAYWRYVGQGTTFTGGSSIMPRFVRGGLALGTGIVSYGQAFAGVQNAGSAIQTAGRGLTGWMPDWFPYQDTLDRAFGNDQSGGTSNEETGEGDGTETGVTGTGIQDFTGDIVNKFYVSSRNFGQATDTYLRWVLESGNTPDEIFKDGNLPEGWDTETLHDGNFVDGKWRTYWEENWQTDPLMKKEISSYFLDELDNTDIGRAAIADAIEKTGLNITVHAEEELAGEYDGDVVALVQHITQSDPFARDFNTYWEPAFYKFTERILDESPRVLSRTYTDEAGQDVTEYLLNTARGISSRDGGDIFDLTSNGMVNPLNVKEQLNYIFRSPYGDYEFLKTQLIGLGYIDDVKSNWSGARDEVTEDDMVLAYTKFQTQVAELNRQHAEAGNIQPLKTGQIRRQIIEDRIEQFTPENLRQKRLADESFLVDSLTSQIASQMADKGWGTVSSWDLTGENNPMQNEIRGLVAKAVNDSITGQDPGTFEERESVKNLIMSLYPDTETIPVNVIDSDSSSIVHAAKYGGISPEIANNFKNGMSLNKARRTLNDIDTHTNEIISYLDLENDFTYNNLRQALNTYITRHDIDEFNTFDLDEMAENAWRSRLMVGADPYGEEIVEDAMAALDRPTLANPDLIGLFDTIGSPRSSGSRVQRSGIRNV